MPKDNARMINTPMMMKSRTRTTIDIGRRDVRATQTGANSGRVKPTRRPPATSLIVNIACNINRSAVTFDPCATDHNRNCSIAPLAS